jgi:hypothetical protein
LENRVITGLAVSSDEKKLAFLSDHISLADKILDFSLTPNEWDKYLRGRQPPPGISVDKPILAAFEDFYKEADIRSH